MLLKIRLFCLFFIFLNGMAYANIDSLKLIWTDTAKQDSVRFDAINNYYTKYLFIQPDSVFSLSSYHIDLANQKDMKKEKAKAFKLRGVVFSLKGDSKNSLKELAAAVKVYSEINDSLGIAHVNNNIAVVFYQQAEYQKSLEYYSKSIAFYKSNNKQEYLASSLINVGAIYLKVNSADIALKYFNESLQLYEKLGKKDKVGPVLGNMAISYFDKGDFYKAFKNNQKAIEVYQELNQLYFVAKCYTYNAKIYKELNQIDSALYYVEQGLKLQKGFGSDLLVVENKILLAEILLSNNDVDEAIKVGEEVLRGVDKYPSYSLKRDMYNLLYECYKKKDSHPLALDMLEKYSIYSDSLRVDQDKIAVIKKSIQEEYEAKLFDARLENELSQGRMKLSQQVNYYIISFLGSALLLCIFFFYKAKRLSFEKNQRILNNKISNLKQLLNTQSKLIQADKMASLGQLTSGVAHEINNPINFVAMGVIGLKKTLLDYFNSSNDNSKNDLLKEMREMIAAIEEGAERSSKIVKSLRQFSRNEDERYTEADIIIGIESTLTLLANKLNKGIVIEKNFDKNEILIYCYPGKINQVFMNILLNAIQAVGTSGVIRISMIDKLENILISISDTGVGISEAEKQKIFEAFYTTKGIQEGTGLGLSISNEIIKSHNGSIEVVNNEPRGTTFIITLPKRDRNLII